MLTTCLTCRLSALPQCLQRGQLRYPRTTHPLTTCSGRLKQINTPLKTHHPESPTITLVLSFEHPLGIFKNGRLNIHLLSLWSADQGGIAIEVSFNCLFPIGLRKLGRVPAFESFGAEIRAEASGCSRNVGLQKLQIWRWSFRMLAHLSISYSYNTNIIIY